MLLMEHNNMICGEGEWRPSKRTYPTLDGVTEKTDRIHLKDAARMLEVSVMTIRRDLSGMMTLYR